MWGGCNQRKTQKILQVLFVENHCCHNKKEIERTRVVAQVYENFKGLLKPLVEALLMLENGHETQRSDIRFRRNALDRSSPAAAE